MFLGFRSILQSLYTRINLGLNKHSRKRLQLCSYIFPSSQGSNPVTRTGAKMKVGWLYNKAVLLVLSMNNDQSRALKQNSKNSFSWKSENSLSRKYRVLTIWSAPLTKILLEDRFLCRMRLARAPAQSDRHRLFFIDFYTTFRQSFLSQFWLGTF